MSQRKDTRKGLGRGLSALIGDAEAVAPIAPAADPVPEPATAPDRLAIDRIDPNPAQPRRRFDEDELADLAASIRERGILQPLIVRPDPAAPGSSGEPEKQTLRDEELFIRFRESNDTEACRTLIDRCHDDLMRFLYRMIGDRQGAEDVFQEAFLQAHRSAASFDEWAAVLRHTFDPRHLECPVVLELAHERLQVPQGHHPTTGSAT